MADNVSKQSSEASNPEAELESDSFLRSDPLVLCEIILPAEVAFECLVAIGNSLEPVHISCPSDGTGCSNALGSVISGPIKQCRDLLMTLGSIKTHLAVHEDYIKMHCTKSNEHGSSGASSDLEEIDSLAMGLKPKSLVDLEASIFSLHKDLMELNNYENEMNKRYISMVHLVNILDCLDIAFWAAKAPISMLGAGIDSRILLDGSSESINESDQFDHTLPFTVGVVPTQRAHNLQLAVWRRFHLTALYTGVTVRDQRDLRDNPVGSHNIFMIVTLSEEQKRLADRLCTLLGAEVFQAPSTRELRRQLTDSTKEQLSEMRQVFLEGDEHRKRLTLSGWGKWKRWYTQLSLIQSVYQALAQSTLGYGKLYYIGEIWCSRDAIDSVQEALGEGSSKTSGVKATVRLVEDHGRSPPTRMPRHEVTAGVQDLIYQFGVPRYREIDPTPFTAVTFPFMFAVMFGDWGHGLLLLTFTLGLFAAWPGSWVLHPDVVAAVRPLREMRYLLLLCSLFAVYCGAVYNEGFGLTVGWRSRSQFSLGNLTYHTVVNRSMAGIQLTPKDAGHVMSWATDSMWGGAANQVKFFNSARMKLSIIFGFLHLLLGLVLQLANDVYSDRMEHLWLFSVAKLAFHCMLMGYPVCLILYKWMAVTPADSACAPALLPMLIGMYRFSYTNTPCYLATFYPGQKYVEHFVVISVLASALLAILGLPICRAVQSGSQLENASAAAEANKEELAKKQRLHSLAPPDGPGDGAGRGRWRRGAGPHEVSGKHFDLLEHGLSCFEFLLSSISHSASYLRLWAIGLAHGELTTIMWPMLLLPPTRLSDMMANSPAACYLIGGLALAITFCIWASITVAILVGMEGMTALLHSLRLHWIEFQSKFYSGDGFVFKPFSLKLIAKQANEACQDFSATEEYQ